MRIAAKNGIRHSHLRGNTSTDLWRILPVRGETTSASPAPVPLAGSTASPGPGGEGLPQEGVSWPTPRFTDNGDDTVTDNLTGLMWHRNADRADGQMLWSEALALANNLSHAGYSDWRLPTVRELLSLVDYSESDPALPAGHPFIWSEDVETASLPFYFWPSTANPTSTVGRWGVALDRGGMESRSSDTNLLFVWPVRG